MYKRISSPAKRRKRKRIKIFAGFALTVAGMLGIFLFLTWKAMGVFGDLSVKTGEEAKTIMIEDSISRNEVLLAGKEDAEKKSGDPIIIVDPGHGGEDEGCSRNDILEKTINLDIAKLLQSKLKDMGYQVIMTREDDTYVSKEQRVEIAKRNQADIYVSIHQKEDDKFSASGIETWYNGTDETKDSMKLAQLVHQGSISSSGAHEGEIKEDTQFYIISETSMPSCLIETGFLSNAKERKRLVTKEYQIKIAEGIAGGIDLYFHPKTMYLTFDDGPSEENTNAVLDILKERGIKATFFVVGKNVRRHPEVARRIVAEGHTIGIHCNEHKYDKIYKSVDSYIKDFEEAYDTVLEVTGVEAKLFRFPGGSINAYNKKISKDIVKEMTDRGYIYFDWNASLEDAVKKAEPKELIANAKETTLGRKKVVLLAHDIVYNTVLCLDDLLDQFPEYKMEALTPDVEPIQFRQ